MILISRMVAVSWGQEKNEIGESMEECEFYFFFFFNEDFILFFKDFIYLFLERG